MDLSEMKVSAKNILMVNDSLNAPILKLNIKLDQSTVVPNTKDLIIYVDKKDTATNERKVYNFSLNEKLNYLNGVTDEFVMEPSLEENKVKVKCYIKRNIRNNAILAAEEIEYLEYNPITLFEGVNYISTNYSNAAIEIVYPKNNDLVNLFLNSTLFGIVNYDKIFSLDDIYFKDCFTEVDEGINAKFNKVTMKCFNSINNAFSMDCEGNLVVNTITTKESSEVNSITLSDVYPVGSIYMSVSATNPSTLFGGTWEQIKGYYLYAGSEIETGGSNATSAASGNTGSTVLTANHLPSHTHSIPALSGTAASNGNHRHTLDGNASTVAGGTKYTRPRTAGQTGVVSYETTTTGAHTHTVTTKASTTGALGSGTGHTHTLNNHTHTITPPFYSVYVWKRIA